MPLDVEIDWLAVDEDNEEIFGCTRVLYALCHPNTDELLYIGKADFCTVRQRVSCRSKDGVWDHIEEYCDTEEAHVLVGKLETDARLTVDLLADVESLLIKRLRPCCNVQSQRSRIERPGLRVTCIGDWPEDRAVFMDR